MALPECDLDGCRQRPHSRVKLPKFGVLTVCRDHAERAEESPNGEVVRRVR